MNRLRQAEGEFLRKALELMRDLKLRTYQFAGVEMARIPGEEKLRVRTSKEQATAEADDDAA